MSEQPSTPDDEPTENAPDAAATATTETSPAPIDHGTAGDDIIDPSAGDVTRDGDGEIVPELVRAGHLGKVEAKPMAYGTVQKFFGSGRTSDLGPGDLAELFRKHIVRPNLDEHYGGLDAKSVEHEMKPLTPRAYLQAIMDVSDIETEQIEMYDDGSAEVEVSGNRT